MKLNQTDKAKLASAKKMLTSATKTISSLATKASKPDPKKPTPSTGTKKAAAVKKPAAKKTAAKK